MSEKCGSSRDTAVLAGTYQEYGVWKRGEGAGVSSFYVDSVEDVLGRHYSKLILIGTWQERPGVERLKLEAEDRCESFS